jgi:hypothetical protein
VGAAGLIWLFFWYGYYDTPARQKRLSRQELAYIQSDADREPEEADNTPVSWRKLLSLRQTWAFGAGKFMTDGNLVGLSVLAARLPERAVWPFKNRTVGSGGGTCT